MWFETSTRVTYQNLSVKSPESRRKKTKDCQHFTLKKRHANCMIPTPKLHAPTVIEKYSQHSPYILVYKGSFFTYLPFGICAIYFDLIFFFKGISRGFPSKFTSSVYPIGSMVMVYLPTHLS